MASSLPLSSSLFINGAAIEDRTHRQKPRRRPQALTFVVQNSGLAYQNTTHTSTQAHTIHTRDGDEENVASALNRIWN